MIIKAVSKQNLRNDLVLSEAEKRLQYIIGSHIQSILNKKWSLGDKIDKTWCILEEQERLRELRDDIRGLSYT